MSPGSSSLGSSGSTSAQANDGIESHEALLAAVSVIAAMEADPLFVERRLWK